MFFFLNSEFCPFDHDENSEEVSETEFLFFWEAIPLNEQIDKKQKIKQSASLKQSNLKRKVPDENASLLPSAADANKKRKISFENLDQQKKNLDQERARLRQVLYFFFFFIL